MVGLNNGKDQLIKSFLIILKTRDKSEVIVVI